MPRFHWVIWESLGTGAIASHGIFLALPPGSWLGCTFLPSLKLGVVMWHASANYMWVPVMCLACEANRFFPRVLFSYCNRLGSTGQRSQWRHCPPGHPQLLRGAVLPTDHVGSVMWVNSFPMAGQIQEAHHSEDTKKWPYKSIMLGMQVIRLNLLNSNLVLTSCDTLSKLLNLSALWFSQV